MTQLHFHLGPVQGFVAQARRTRDLWAGSFLIAYLSGVAMAKVRALGGVIEKPFLGDGEDLDPLIARIEGRSGDETPSASLPNHFTADIDGDEEATAAVAREAASALQAAWRKVADAVYEAYVAPVEGQGQGTRKIFDRQIDSTWEVFWAVGHDHAVLADRKRMRLFAKPAEFGDKCTLCGDLEELSGHGRSGKRTRASMRDQRAFWEALRERLGGLDLHKDERLSAPALVKRLFPKVADEALGWSHKSVHWPSTAYLAAVPFIDAVLTQDGLEAQAADYARAASSLAEDARAPRTAIRFRGNPAKAQSFTCLDGNFFFPLAVADANRTPFKKPDPDGGEREALIAKLRGLARGLEPARPHFALLLADGDRLGRMISNALKNDLKILDISKALSDFAHAARRVITEHRGVTVYAGGDDVLALLSAEDGLKAADALEQAWQVAMEPLGRHGMRPTLSAALILAPYRTPLRRLITSAHHLLDDVAKDGNGRDSVAVSLWKGSGEDARWVTTWKREHVKDTERALAQLESLAKEVKVGVDGGGLSTSFLHGLEQLLALLTGKPGWGPGDRAEIGFDTEAQPDMGLDVEALIRAEYSQSVSVSAGSSGRKEIEQVAGELRELMRPHTSDEGELVPSKTQLEVDAPILARFLAAPPKEEN